MSPEIENARVERALMDILSSEKFVAAPQMSAFLNYVVNETLTGDPARIKAYSVAVDALGKPATFDPQNDPSVRVLAKRLRTSLDLYYQLYPATDVIIELKPGSYVPRFVQASLALTAGSPDGPDTRARACVPESVGVSTAAESAMALVHPNAAGNPETVPVNCTDAPAMGTSAPAPESVMEARRPDDETGQTGSYDAPAKHHEKASDAKGGSLDASGQRLTKSTGRILSRLPPPAIAASVAVAVLMFIGVVVEKSPDQAQGEMAKGNGTASSEYPESTARLNDRLLEDRPELASAQLANPEHDRPANPVVYIDLLESRRRLENQIAESISSVVSRFNDIDVIRSSPPGPADAHWPENYRLLVSTIHVDDSIQLKLQLLQASTGRIVHSHSLNFSAHATQQLTGDELAAVEAYSARLSQWRGPLLADYHRQGELNLRTACWTQLYELTDYGNIVPVKASLDVATTNIVDASSSEGIEQCLESLANDDQDDPSIIFRVQAMLALATSLGNDDAPMTAIEQAVAMSRRAVQELPYNAYAHLTLMMSLRKAGQIDEAAESGRRSHEINPFDGRILREYSQVLKSKGNDVESSRLLEVAHAVDPYGNTILF